MFQQLTSCVPLLLVLSATIGWINGKVILQAPQSLNISQGSTAIFNCQASSNTLVIGWTINNLSAVTYEDSTVSTVYTAAGIYSSTLTVNATAQLNNSVVSCVAVVQSPVSASALLLVQGPLQAVANLTVSRFNSTFLQFSFVPPPSLLNVPIISYHMILMGHYTTNSSISITLANDTLTSLVPLPNLCDVFTLSLTGWNGAGEGTRANGTVSVIEAPIIDPASLNITIYRPSLDELPQANITLQIYQPNCNSHLSHYIKVNTGSHTHSYGPLSLTDGWAELVLDQLADNRFYNLVIWDENVGGTSNTISTTLSTFGVQGASGISPQEGVLCISCSFMSGSNERGCYAELVHLSAPAAATSTGYTALHISRSSLSQQLVSGCVSKLEEGQYTISIYDIEWTGETDTTLAALTEPLLVEIVTNGSSYIEPHPSNTSTDQAETSSSSLMESFPIATGVTNSTSLVTAYRDTAISVGSLLVALLLILMILLIYQLRKRRHRKVWETAAERGEGTLRRTSSFQSKSTTEYERPCRQQLQDEELLNQRDTTPSSDDTVAPSPSLVPPSPPPPPVLLTASSPQLDLPAISDTQSDTALISTKDDSSLQYQSRQAPPKRSPERSNLRRKPVLSAWAAVNQLALPVLPEGPPLYEDIADTTNSDRPHSTISLTPRINTSSTHSVSQQSLAHIRHQYPIEYAQLQFPPVAAVAAVEEGEEEEEGEDSGAWYRSSRPLSRLSAAPVGGVQYSIINSYGYPTDSVHQRPIIAHTLV